MKRLLGIDICSGFGLSVTDAVPHIAAAGFDACFTGWNDGVPVTEWADAIARAGLIYQSVHAPYNRVNTVWDEGGEGEVQIDRLIACLNDCERCGVPIMVAHPIIGMDKHTPGELGIRRFSRLIEAAEKTHVRVAFENVEGIEYLDYIMSSLGASDSVGFCFDTGHEMCYNFSRDVMAKYGGKLICTHLNDNMGMADPDTVTWLDDSHLIPGDGVGDWQGIADRLNRDGYTGILTFELTRNNKPGKHTHDRYAALDYDGFLALAHSRAEWVASLCDR